MGLGLLIHTVLQFGRAHWFAFLILFSLVVGVQVADQVIVQPKVAVIPVYNAVLTKAQSDHIVRMLEGAHERDDVAAVVLDIESPGSEVTVAEDMFMNVLSLRRKKPVVASINQIGTSGAYYLSLPANTIMAKPSSLVGSIGVRAGLPKPMESQEGEIVSGPFKGPGLMKMEKAAQIETIKDNFLDQVVAYRGEKLSVSRHQLAMAGVYLGVEARDLGLVDELGSTSDAIDRAASMAGVDNWEVIYMDDELHLEEGVTALGGNGTVSRLPARPAYAPVYYFLYVD